MNLKKYSNEIYYVVWNMYLNMASKVIWSWNLSSDIPLIFILLNYPCHRRIFNANYNSITLGLDKKPKHHIVIFLYLAEYPWVATIIDL